MTDYIRPSKHAEPTFVSKTCEKSSEMHGNDLYCSCISWRKRENSSYIRCAEVYSERSRRLLRVLGGAMHV